MITKINEWKLFKKKLNDNEKINLIIDTIIQKIGQENIIQNKYTNEFVFFDRKNNATVQLKFNGGFIQRSCNTYKKI